MKRLFINEWMKIRYSKLLWILFAGILALTLVFAVCLGGAPGTGYYVGITASFEYMTFGATMIMMLLAPVVAIFFTQELQEGTMHNTLSCGVSRRQYFAAKTICITVSGLAIYLMSVLLYTCTRTLMAGFAPASLTYPDCNAAVTAIFQLGCCLQVFTYLTCFLLISVLFKRTAFVNLTGIVIWYGDATLSVSFPFWRGPMASSSVSYDLWEEGKVLTTEFLKQYSQCIIMSIVFLALSYFVFMKRDIN